MTTRDKIGFTLIMGPVAAMVLYAIGYCIYLCIGSHDYWGLAALACVALMATGAFLISTEPNK